MKITRAIGYFLIGLILSVTGVMSASGQMERNFPPDSKLGNLNGASFPQFNIDGNLMIMGAAGQVRDSDNQIVLPNATYKRGAIRYQIDMMGNLHRIWYLTEEEAKGEKKIK
ncbi:hypothetical protein [Nitrosomonas sp. PY1]|uniref:hypothetical protein n=1 Tax=Nitrosomonas sp. PY1 TaxID=1803906 RepID=UPI001FC7DE47|nr:hypothetical protein [Nitrosomonas sp. PY1]